MIHDNTISVGACGWDQPQWQGVFFPDDLPEDWRLSYYANEFSAVLVPQHKWQAADVDFEQWADDVPDGFKFYFLSHSLSVDEAVIKGCLGDKFAGFVTVKDNPHTALISFSAKSLREWKDWLLATHHNAVFLIDEDLSIKQLADFSSLTELMGL